MTTTFEKFAGTCARNYCKLPTIDVEILARSLECEECRGALVEVAPTALRRYVHAVEVAECRAVRPRPRPCCRYCGGADALVHDRGDAWADYTRCGRCGGVDGFPLGD